MVYGDFNTQLTPENAQGKRIKKFARDNNWTLLRTGGWTRKGCIANQADTEIDYWLIRNGNATTHSLDYVKELSDHKPILLEIQVREG